jgi:hypothetical protein
MKYLNLVFVLSLLTACYEDPDVIVHEPGVYKGKVDKHALTEKERSEVLSKRFLQVQTDR